jgi:hypothetical protein
MVRKQAGRANTSWQFAPIGGFGVTSVACLALRDQPLTLWASGWSEFGGSPPGPGAGPEKQRADGCLLTVTGPAQKGSVDENFDVLAIILVEDINDLALGTGLQDITELVQVNPGNLGRELCPDAHSPINQSQGKVNGRLRLTRSGIRDPHAEPARVPSGSWTWGKR